MKVTNNSLNPISTGKPESGGPAGKAARNSEARPAEKRDRAELSEQARLMSKAQELMGELSPETSSRLEALRNSVQSGNYEIPVEKLAHALASRLKNL